MPPVAARELAAIFFVHHSRTPYKFTPQQALWRPAAPENRHTMFSFIRKRRDTSPETIGPDSQLPRRMDLAERQAFRRQMLEQVLHDTLAQLGLLPAVQRWRLFPQDERHHRFIAVVDVSAEFGRRCMAASLQETAIEAALRRNALERCGLGLEAVYWRSRALTRSAGAAAPERSQYQLVSEEEKEALMEAIRQGAELPVLHVGELEYQTDMAPFDDGLPDPRQAGG